MKTAILDGVVLAKSDQTVVVEGNHYFPPESLTADIYNETELTTGCPWKGTANYYSVVVNGTTHENVAWTYRNPKDAAIELKDRVAFYPAVTVT